MQKHYGLTMIELLVVMALTVGLILAASTTHQSWLRERVMSNTAAALLQGLRFTRNHALVTHARTVMCPRTESDGCGENNYEAGWFIFVESPGSENGEIDSGERILQSFVLEPGDITIRSNNFTEFIAFAPGRGTSIAGSFVLCLGGDTEGSRLLVVSNTGRARLTKNDGDDPSCFL